MPNKTLPLKAAMDELLAVLRELLSPRQYEVYWLYEIAGLSEKEIAYKLGVSQSAVSRYLTAARRKMRRAMSNDKSQGFNQRAGL